MNKLTLCPNFARAGGREPATSAKPPVFANGVASEATKAIESCFVTDLYSLP